MDKSRGFNNAAFQQTPPSGFSLGFPHLFALLLLRALSPRETARENRAAAIMLVLQRRRGPGLKR